MGTRDAAAVTEEPGCDAAGGRCLTAGAGGVEVRGPVAVARDVGGASQQAQEPCGVEPLRVP